MSDGPQADDGGLGALFDGDDEDDGRTVNTAGEDAEVEPVAHTVELDMEGMVGVYQHQRHRNGDETMVVLTALADGYQALAIEVDAGGDILATEEIGTADADSRAASMCEYWLDQNPKGILGGQEDGGGLLSGLFGGGD